MLQCPIQVPLGISQHLVLCPLLNRFVKSILNDGYSAQEVWVTVAWKFLPCLCEERNGILILLLLQTFETLAHYHVERGARIQLLNGIALKVVFKCLVIFIRDKVPICPVEIDQWRDVVLLIHW